MACGSRVKKPVEGKRKIVGLISSDPSIEISDCFRIFLNLGRSFYCKRNCGNEGCAE